MPDRLAQLIRSLDRFGRFYMGLLALEAVVAVAVITADPAGALGSRGYEIATAFIEPAGWAPMWAILGVAAVTAAWAHSAAAARFACIYHFLLHVTFATSIAIQHARGEINAGLAPFIWLETGLWSLIVLMIPWGWSTDVRSDDG